MINRVNQNIRPDDLPSDVLAYLESVPPATPEMAAWVAAAYHAIKADPTFQADYLKSVFVATRCSALEERHEKKATLAAQDCKRCDLPVFRHGDGIERLNMSISLNLLVLI